MAGFTQPPVEAVDEVSMQACPVMCHLWLVALRRARPSEELLRAAFSLLDGAHPARRN